jgi:hypothetical protein
VIDEAGLPVAGRPAFLRKTSQGARVGIWLGGDIAKMFSLLGRKKS